jgi:outer membrane biosynthesis protein TonB
MISKPRARYTDEARYNNVTGTIKIAVEYQADGSIGFTIPVESLPHGLTQNALQSARQIRFQPAVRNGNAVTVVGIVEYTFSIY